MMITSPIINYYKNVIIFDLITKLNIINIYKIPKIKKINLNITCKNKYIKKEKLIYILLFLNLITNQKPFLKNSKFKQKITLNMKKNKVIGCKLTLQKQAINLFLEKLIFFILPKIKDIKFNYKKIKNIFNFKIINLFNFFEFKNEFFKFKDLTFLTLDISIQTNCENSKQLFLLLNFFFFNKIAKIT